MNLHLVEFDRKVLDKTFKWLNDPEVKFLTATPDINKSSQSKWFETLADRKDYFIKGIRVNDQDTIGVVGLKKINFHDGKAEYFGYIGNKSYWGQGIGSWMMDSAIATAKLLGLCKIYLYVICNNYVAINLYFKKEFKIISLNDNTYTMERSL